MARREGRAPANAASKGQLKHGSRMRFAAPEWLILVPLLGLAGYFWPSLRLLRPWRLLCQLLIILLLVRPELRRASDGLDLWVLVDQSASAADLLKPLLPEWEMLLERSRGSEDRLHFVDFAKEAVERGAILGAGGTAYSGSRSATRMTSAARHALSLMKRDRSNRLLVLSDGYSTEPMTDLPERLAREQVALDYRLARASVVGDVRLAALTLPRRVMAQEAFVLDIVAVSDEDQTVPVDLTRNGSPLARKEIRIANGKGHLRLTDRLGKPGAYQYEARLLPKKDTLPGNNSARQWVEVGGGPRVLLVTSYTPDPLAEALRAQGFEVETVTEVDAAGVGLLSGVKAVILNNVPAYRLPASFQSALPFFVSEQGGGLAMVGGKYSFATGGYFGSPLEPLLPVSMELKQEHRKLAVAIAIVMDRSGSMSVNVPGTAMQKMDLANEGAARAIDLLGDSDMVSVFAVDSSPHRIVPLSPVGQNRSALTSVVRRVESTGGGIFVYTGLRAAWVELQMAHVGQRHVILFADAADAEEPGDYVRLIEDMVKNKTSVSVIGLGTEKDSDAAFLKDVAARGKGRIFFNQDANELPALFAQETVAVARSAFIDEPVGVKGTLGWMELADTPMDWLKSVDGYNLSYLKPGAAQAAVSADEYAAPLLAFWQRGAGRVAAVSFPLGGDFSTAARAWPHYGDLCQSLGRWLLGEQLPPGIGITARVNGTQLVTELFYEPEWNARLTASPPRLILNRNAENRTTDVTWERIAPGQYRATQELEGDDWVRGAVRVGNTALPFGPLNAAVNPEWSFDKERLADLRATSTRSGGQERVDLSDVWHAPRAPAWTGINHWLLVALILVLLMEAWRTRVAGV